VTRFQDVAEVLQRPNVFNVPYAAKLSLIMDGDNIFLSMKDEPNYTHDKTNMRMAAPRAESMVRVKPDTARIAAEVLQSALARC